MSDADSAIRAEIEHHEREIERLRRMLAAGGAAGETSIRDIILAQLATGPKSVGEMLTVAQCKPNSFYVQLSRMKKANEIARDTDGKYQKL